MTRARDIANVTVTPTFPDGSINIADLNIDGGTDIGAALVDADLMIVDDAAGGTNRKATMTRLSTYMATKIGGGMVFLASSGAISNAASVAFTQFDASAYDQYKFYFMYVKPVTDNVTLQTFVSTDGGSSYDTTGSNYLINGDNTTANGLATNDQNTLGNAAAEYGLSGYLDIYGPHLTTFTYSISETCTMNPDSTYIAFMGAPDGNRRITIHKVAADVDAVKFQMSSGNITTGEITMFGVVNS
tara:strand:- start:32 stop:763 length:732 start_codon:yes stop_codon:yes gene_type:complete